MRFDGLWERCEDGIVRPLLSAEVLSESGSWHSVAMLIDTGADRTATLLGGNHSYSIQPI